MTTRFSLAFSLAQESAVLPDGTLWSQAATFGPLFYEGQRLEMGPPLFRNFKRLFEQGIRGKCPVDYDHGTTNGIADGSRPVPKAGDVRELAVVEKPEDLTEPMRVQLAKGGRAPEDPTALGLWIRWRPTPTALRFVQNGEYTELSIAWGPYIDARTGKHEGDALFAVAITNLPMLQNMVSVAASGRNGGTPADPGHEEPTMNRLLTALTARFGKPAVTEDDGITVLDTGVADKDRQIRELSGKAGALDAIVAEVGATDSSTAIAKVRELKTAAATAATQASEARTRELTATRDGHLTRLEKKYLPAQKDYFARQLMADLQAGKDDTVKLLEAMPDLQVTGRASGADNGTGGAAVALDQKIDERAKALRRENADLVELAKTNPSEALRQSILMAGKELGYAGSAAR